MTYPIQERFYTFQGEGFHMGRPAFFIRLYGCPLHCTFCDSAGTWHKDYVPDHIERMEAGVLAAEALASGAQMVVITGGEPGIFDLTELIQRIQMAGLYVSIETSGAFQLRGAMDGYDGGYYEDSTWVTVSPKRAKPPIKENWWRADELKLIIEEPADILFWQEQVLENDVRSPHVWLHPEWSQRENPIVLNAITNAVKLQVLRYRAGWQVHKLYRADLLDNRTAKAVPLGGNPAKGY